MVKICHGLPKYLDYLTDLKMNNSIWKKKLLQISPGREKIQHSCYGIWFIAYFLVIAFKLGLLLNLFLFWILKCKWYGVIHLLKSVSPHLTKIKHSLGSCLQKGMEVCFLSMVLFDHSTPVGCLPLRLKSWGKAFLSGIRDLLANVAYSVNMGFNCSN